MYFFNKLQILWKNKLKEAYLEASLGSSFT